MNRKRLVTIFVFVASIILSIMGGFILGKDANKKEFNSIGVPNISQSINIRITNTQRIPASGTTYTLVLRNTSQYLIKQNSVYLSYPIKHGESGQAMTMNKCKVEAIGNKLDIKPNQEVTLNVFIPCENYENNNKIDSNRPQFEIEGYFNEVSTLTHFQRSGDFPK